MTWMGGGGIISFFWQIQKNKDFLAVTITLWIFFLLFFKGFSSFFHLFYGGKMIVPKMISWKNIHPCLRRSSPSRTPRSRISRRSWGSSWLFSPITGQYFSSLDRRTKETCFLSNRSKKSLPLGHKSCHHCHHVIYSTINQTSLVTLSQYHLTI